jgi:2-polyprenyl-3-methyl-5-hydroxy-6-metoxy-1,4-benzoquinol methylase
LSHGGDVLALNNAYGFLRDRGIDPDYFMLLDARRENIDFVSNPADSTRHFLSAQCHPDIFDSLDNVTLYFSHEENAKGIKGKKTMLSAPAGTVGMKALSLGFALGYREFHLYGYDSSYGDTHHAYPQPLNDNSNVIDVYIEKGGDKYITSPSFSHQAVEFVPFSRNLVELGCSIELHCSGLLPDLVRYSNERGEIPLEIREKEKYTQIWEIEKYGKFAPGETFVDKAIEALGIEPGDLVIDYGCGSGKGAALMASKGMYVTGVDFAENCPGARNGNFEFINACLWDMPEMLGDWAYCTDVMEHIPPEKVLDVVKGIHDRTKKGAFFNIATRDDVMGGNIGKRLHMTVMPAKSWENILSEFWSVTTTESEGEATFVCKPKIGESNVR